MSTSWISFGPDLEPLETEARRGVHAPGARRDGVTVTGTSDEVVSKLAEASALAGGWCRLEEVLGPDERRSVYVNAAAARLVVDVE